MSDVSLSMTLVPARPLSCLRTSGSRDTLRLVQKKQVLHDQDPESPSRGDVGAKILPFLLHPRLSTFYPLSL